MKNYRLKSEAVQFFSESVSTSIMTLPEWKENRVDINALEEVEDMYITYGHKNLDKNTGYLSGWSADGVAKGSHFHFTIIFPSTKHMEHDRFCKGKSIRKLMDQIQLQMNDYFKNYFSE